MSPLPAVGSPSGKLGISLSPLRFVTTQIAQTLHNGWGILNVWDLILLRPMAGGLIDLQHPFCTGIEPETGERIWSRNVVYASARRRGFTDTDDEIVARVGGYMAAMVRRAARRPGYPEGRPQRMRPAIYYIHGGVHYHGGWWVFDDFADAIRHFTDPGFEREFARFIRVERREPLLVFRERDPDPESYSNFIGFLRRRLPYFANSNGRTEIPLWGNTSPYPTVNVVTGNWIRDVRMLASERGQREVLRAPISRRYFETGPYDGARSEVTEPERKLAALHQKRIRMRGERGNVYFVDRRDWTDAEKAAE